MSDYNKIISTHFGQLISKKQRAKLEAMLTEQSNSLLSNRPIYPELVKEVERLNNLVEIAFREGYARRNSQHYSRDWKQFCIDNNINDKQ